MLRSQREAAGSNPVPATTFVITHSPYRSNRGADLALLRNAEADDERSGCIYRYKVRPSMTGRNRRLIYCYGDGAGVRISWGAPVSVKVGHHGAYLFVTLH